jgi:hypothetical protein
MKGSPSRSSSGNGLVGVLLKQELIRCTHMETE